MHLDANKSMLNIFIIQQFIRCQLNILIYYTLTGFNKIKNIKALSDYKICRQPKRQIHFQKQDRIFRLQN